ncbi:hypothetical protein H310_06367 [Aphanomyces invadans]|uniref:Methyltransferase domain-containing protein n=1 Tax=Aphanomyces invadans TaxID=157072 RepID=A0A024U5V0_9STRA|nr:hypothetical protein H310_06367 [Aphanomyces invadans]ETW01786.1 hypothetical protein H310_06367 [Aphanomyces invadans]|eukprot:XP_008869634.1 hypothetical protein H310_06367 [Aphanomyces invadans]
MAIAEETVEFGDAGTYSFFQYGSADYNHMCLTSNSASQDSTGLRVYSGAQVMARFLASADGLALLRGKRVIELGCGTGVIGCVAGARAILSDLVLTDGDERAVALAQRNLEHVVHSIKPELSTACRQLYWGASYPPSLGAFDVVLGCDLMYYQTNVEDLMWTVESLAPSGLFLHVHIFRKDEHGDTMLQVLAKSNRTTLVVPIPHFISIPEVANWPSWLNVCCLISGPSDQIQVLLAAHPTWSLFVSVEATQDENFKATEVDEDA